VHFEDTELLGHKTSRLENFALNAPVFIQRFFIMDYKKKMLFLKKEIYQQRL
jgi:hypothetical protein